MLDITLLATDDAPAIKLSFEHSLLSLSKWEALYEKSFFGREPKTGDEMESYVNMMLLTEDPPENFISRFQKEDYENIARYIDSKQTATTFGPEPQQKASFEVITAELIYFWLVQFQIPFSPVETWHLNRVFTLVKVASVKNSKPKKMNKQELAEKYRQLNEERRRKSGTAG